MKFRIKKTWVGVLGVALALSTAGGIAIATAAEQEGAAAGVATVPDPYKTAVPLKLYNAAGTEITTGTTTTQIAGFAAADGDVRAGDDHASLFVHRPQSSNAPGDWPGLQVSGTDKFTGAGAVTAPAGPGGKPFVRADQAGYTLAQVATVLPNTESSASFVGVYELRLRTSSAAKGVSDQYAATYVKITGSSWAVTTAPVLGGDGGPTTTPPTTTPPAGVVGTSVAATWPATLTYGTAASVGVTVTPASGAAKPTGTVRLVSGSTTLATATLANGAATLSLSGTALTPGSRSYKVVYPGATAFGASESAVKSVSVAKAAAGKPTYKTTKLPTPKKKGAGTVTVSTPGGLAVAGGTATVVLKSGAKSITVKVTIASGSGKVKLPKLKPGVWTVTVTYDGDANYTGGTSKAYKFKVKAPKKK